MQITKGNAPGYWKTEIKIAEMRSQLVANEFAHIYGLQSETGTPARNALSEHYPSTALKIPLTAFVLDTSGKGFDNPAETHALYGPPNFPEFMILHL